MGIAEAQHLPRTPCSNEPRTWATCLLALCLWFVASLSATAASTPASSSGQSAATPIYSVTYVGMPVTGSCEPVSQRTSAALDRALARHEAGRMLSARCVPFGDDPDSWLLLDVLVSDQNATLPTIVSTLRELGASPKTEISFDSVQPQQDSVTVVLGGGALSQSSESGARSLDGSRPRVGPAEGDSTIDIGSSTTEGRQVLKFKTGDVFAIQAATGERAAVQFVVIGIHHVEYRFRYRPRGSESLISGHDRAVEHYRIDRHDSDGNHLSELPGHDVTLRIGKLRAEWSSAGPDEGFVYYDPRVASIRNVTGIDFEKLP